MTFQCEHKPFSELLEFIVDNRGKSAPTSSVGIPLIKTESISNENLYPKVTNQFFVSQETYATWFRSHPQPGDIIVVNKGSYNGAVCLVPDPVGFCIAQDMVAVRPNKSIVDPLFLLAVLRSEIVQTRIRNLNVSSAIPHFKKTDFDKLLIPYPSRDVQQEIGRIYYEFSRKIELNQQMNRTLEAIARALFKSWFIDFDPVHAKMDGRQPADMDAETAALFPDEFEDSAIGKIPKEWRVEDLQNVTSYLQRGIQPKYIEEDGVLVINQKCIRDHRLNLNHARRHDPSKRSIEGRELKVGDILVNSTGVGTLGRVAQVLHLEETTIVDSHVTVVRAKPKSTTLHYLGLSLLERESAIEMLGEGSTGQTELSRARLGALSILVPEFSIQEYFDRQISPFREQIVAHERQSANLAYTRDTLLPNLLSGELSTKCAERIVEIA